MLNNADRLLDLAHSRGVVPSRYVRKIDGSQCFTWYLCDDLDRFVRVENSVRGDELLVTVRDDKSIVARPLLDGGEKVCAVLRSDPGRVLDIVEYVLSTMTKGEHVELDRL